MSYIRQLNPPFFGLGVSILFHALFFCGLIFTKCTPKVEAKMPPVIEIATIILKSEITNPPQQNVAVISAPPQLNNLPAIKKEEKKKIVPKLKNNVKQPPKKVTKKIVTDKNVDFSLTPVEKSESTATMTETDAITGHENDTNNKAVSGSHNSTINGKTVDNSFN